MQRFLKHICKLTETLFSVFDRKKEWNEIPKKCFIFLSLLCIGVTLIHDLIIQDTIGLMRDERRIMTRVLFRIFSGGVGRLHSPLKTPLVMTPGFLKRLIILYLGSRFVIESDGLVVQGVRKDDGGVYTCRARVPETGELEERDIQLEVKLDKYQLKPLSCPNTPTPLGKGRFWMIKKLSLCHKQKFSNSYIFATWWCKPCIFTT